MRLEEYAVMRIRGLEKIAGWADAIKRMLVRPASKQEPKVVGDFGLKKFVDAKSGHSGYNWKPAARRKPRT